ncbi:hypothetical protein OsJ_22149 [Oryza sativa Japonica Group]|uniref:Methyltransferase type 11 domain-containing protein n=1 Tax=Oryza sativa subsp. japonica TaxID=39947 RepID=B9FQ71_ORYSJ|nr:hypothetical protein OsJ_22149 [Oryza sativa Japonica Group]
MELAVRAAAAASWSSGALVQLPRARAPLRLLGHRRLPARRVAVEAAAIAVEPFQMAQDYFQSVAGGVLLDVSCGSGLFTRKFAKSGSYSAVIALDFSENMLCQCYEFIQQDDTLVNTNLALVRADISRLPFASSSIDAIHAGAAIHCWPSPSNAVAEISRVLRPGGVFVATTFLSSPRNNPFSVEALRPLRQIVGPVNTSYNYFTEGELEDLCKSCGLVNYSSKVQRSFIMFSGQKP